VAATAIIPSLVLRRENGRCRLGADCYETLFSCLAVYRPCRNIHYRAPSRRARSTCAPKIFAGARADSIELAGAARA